MTGQDFSKTTGFWPVLAALLGNFFVGVAKFFGFLVSGSGALFSEAIHSLADTANQSLLIIGVRRSVKKPTKVFPYGYGRERFIFALISACGIFFVGCGVTVYHGITSLLDPSPVHFRSIALYILFFAFVIESGTLWLAIRDIRKHFPKDKLKVILKEADPTTLAVVYEDGLAVVGVLVAFVSIVLTYMTGQVYWDAIGSIIIGLLLGVAAIILINKNRHYLITRSIPKDLEDELIELIESDPFVEKVSDFKSAILDVDKYLIKFDIEFNASALAKELSNYGFLEDEYEEVKESYHNFMKFCVEYADRVPRMVGKKIDGLEKKIRQLVPQAVFIDIEIN